MTAFGPSHLAHRIAQHLEHLAEPDKVIGDDILGLDDHVL